MWSPVLLSRTSVLIHPKRRSLQLLTLDSQSVPLLSSSTLATTRLFSVSVSLLLFYRQVHLCHISGSTCKRYCMLFVFLI